MRNNTGDGLSYHDRASKLILVDIPNNDQDSIEKLIAADDTILDAIGTKKNKEMYFKPKKSYSKIDRFWTVEPKNKTVLASALLNGNTTVKTLGLVLTKLGRDRALKLVHVGTLGLMDRHNLLDPKKVISYEKLATLFAYLTDFGKIKPRQLLEAIDSISHFIKENNFLLKRAYVLLANIDKWMNCIYPVVTHQQFRPLFEAYSTIGTGYDALPACYHFYVVNHTLRREKSTDRLAEVAYLDIVSDTQNEPLGSLIQYTDFILWTKADTALSKLNLCIGVIAARLMMKPVPNVKTIQNIVGALNTWCSRLQAKQLKELTTLLSNVRKKNEYESEILAQIDELVSKLENRTEEWRPWNHQRVASPDARKALRTLAVMAKARRGSTSSDTQQETEQAQIFHTSSS